MRQKTRKPIDEMQIDQVQLEAVLKLLSQNQCLRV
jgi:hypothetical protein